MLLLLSEQMLAQWWHPAASSEALDRLHRAMRVVLYRCIAMAIKMASNVGIFFHCCCFAWDPGSRRGITEQVVAQWQHTEAFGVSLDMLHQGICSALHPCPRMAIKMASEGVTFVPHHQFHHQP